MALLDKNRTVATPAPKAKTKEASDKITIKGLDDFAKVDSVKKSIETLHKTLCDEVKGEASEILIGQGIQYGKRPANLKATEGDADASIQLKVLPSALSEDAQAVLNAAKIPVREDDVVVKTFIINPAYADNEAIMKALETALEGVEGIPEDLFQFQERKKVCVDGDRTLDAIFQLKTKGGAPDRARIESLLPLVSTLAVRATTKATLEDALDTVDELILETEDADKAI